MQNVLNALIEKQHLIRPETSKHTQSENFAHNRIKGQTRFGYSYFHITLSTIIHQTELTLLMLILCYFLSILCIIC
jgi:hypothetical protein